MHVKKYHNVVCYLLLALSLFTFGACQQMQEEEWMDVDAERHELKIEARAHGEDLIDYPLYLYAFAENGQLVASQVIEDTKEPIHLQLPSGSFHITAVSGVSSDYRLPERLTKDETILMPDSGYATKPMMMGKADVTISSQKSTSLNLTLSYAVCAVTISLNGIESDVDEVIMKLSPLYSALTLGGTYTSENKVVEIPCSLQGEGKWGCQTVYVLPGCEAETVFSILMKKKDQSESTFSYVYHGKPLANRPFIVNGTYTGEISVGGEYITQDWGEPIEVNFDFGAASGTDLPEDPGKVDVSYVSQLPTAGTIWNHTLVAMTTPITEKEEEVVLFSLDEWLQPVSMVEEVKNGYSVNGIKNWRLPSWTEAKQLQIQWGDGVLYDINDRIQNYDSSLLKIDDNDRYLCDKNGDYYSFVIMSGNAPSVAGTKKSYLIRLAKTYRLKVR